MVSAKHKLTQCIDKKFSNFICNVLFSVPLFDSLLILTKCYVGESDASENEMHVHISPRVCHECHSFRILLGFLLLRQRSAFLSDTSIQGSSVMGEVIFIILTECYGIIDSLFSAEAGICQLTYTNHVIIIMIQNSHNVRRTKFNHIHIVSHCFKFSSIFLHHCLSSLFIFCEINPQLM